MKVKRNLLVRSASAAIVSLEISIAPKEILMKRVYSLAIAGLIGVGGFTMPVTAQAQDVCASYKPPYGTSCVTAYRKT